MGEKAIEKMSREELLAERQEMVERVLARDAKGEEKGAHIDNSRGSAEWQEAAARFREVDELIFKQND